jgi:formamidopyrimidine-DNA glycosylase
MPELPEVETVRFGLQRLLPGKQIAGVTFDTVKSFPNAPADVEQFLIGAKILEVKRRAKVLIIELDTKYSLLIHLKMTGQLVYVGTKSLNPGHDLEERFGAGHPSDSLVGQLPDRSTRVILNFQNKVSGLRAHARKNRSTEQNVQVVHSASTGDPDAAGVQERWRSFGLRPKADRRDAELYFNDQRKFGWVKLLPTAEIPTIDFMKKLGPEPLATDFSAQDFKARLLRRPKTTIKAALLDQSVIAGVGNIYADESLWGAKIHPSTLVKNVSTAKLNTLFVQLQAVLQLSIDRGGSSDRNYVNAEGKKGSYLSFAHVFRRQGQPCSRCGTTIIKTRVAGRGTHFCPFCQKEPK